MSSKGQNRQRRKGLALQKKVRRSLGLESPVLYDPADGWKYGFPKPYNPLPGEILSETLVRDGYPQALIDKGYHAYTRFIGGGGDVQKALDTCQGNLAKRMRGK